MVCPQTEMEFVGPQSALDSKWGEHPIAPRVYLNYFPHREHNNQQRMEDHDQEQ